MARSIPFFKTSNFNINLRYWDYKNSLNPANTYINLPTFLSEISYDVAHLTIVSISQKKAPAVFCRGF